MYARPCRKNSKPEATLTAEQKVERRMKEALTIENRAIAREKLVESGITGEELSEILELVVTDDQEATLAKVENLPEWSRKQSRKNRSVTHARLSNRPPNQRVRTLRPRIQGHGI